MIKVVKKYNLKKIMVVVVDLKMGKVFVMGQCLSFDLNMCDVMNYYNDLILYVYESGLMMKIFIFVVVIQENVYNGNEKYKFGIYKVGGGIVRDYNEGVGWGLILYYDGVVRFFNVVFVKLVNEKLGYICFDEYFYKFNFY